MEGKKLKLIQKILEELFAYLKIEANFKIEEKEDTLRINIETNQPGILIGYHGRTLSALQRILSLTAYRQLNERIKIVLDVANYRQKREETLRRMAMLAAQKAKSSGQEQELPPMSSQERRIIHLALGNDSQVTTESRGEGKTRRVVIKPKK